jgi:hypothetical protein
MEISPQELSPSLYESQQATFVSFEPFNNNKKSFDICSRPPNFCYIYTAQREYVTVSKHVPAI